MKKTKTVLSMMGVLMACASAARAGDLTDPIDNTKTFVTRPVLVANMVASCDVVNNPSDTSPKAVAAREEILRHQRNGYDLAALIPLKGVITDGSFTNGFVGYADTACAYIFVRQPGVK